MLGGVLQRGFVDAARKVVEAAANQHMEQILVVSAGGDGEAVITFYEISLVFDPADVTALAKQVVASAPKASAVSRLSAAPPAYAAQSWSPVSLDTWGSGAPAIDAAPYSAPFAEPDEDEDSEEDKLFDSDEYLFFDLSNDALLAAEEIDDDLI